MFKNLQSLGFDVLSRTSISTRSVPWIAALAMAGLIAPQVAWADSSAQSPPFSQQSLQEARKAGAKNSKYHSPAAHPKFSGPPEPDLVGFHADIQPILAETCFKCHGEKRQKADFRVDTLNPDLFAGEDVAWWLEVSDVITNGEMPPDDEDEMPDAYRSKVIEWLSGEIQGASQVRRSEQGHSSFRRMTRYEYNYALQDLLGLSFDLADDLPPETHSEDGFQNSSEMLQMSAVQFQTYREIARDALQKATVRGERPRPAFYGISIEDGHGKVLSSTYAEKVAALEKEFNEQPARLKEGIDQLNADRFTKPSGAHIFNLDTKEFYPVRYRYRGNAYVHYPTATLPEVPDEFRYLLVLPADQSHVIDLGDTLPDHGTLRLRVLASRTSDSKKRVPSLRLDFGFSESNNATSYQSASSHDIAIDAPLNKPQFYQWDIPLESLRRNPHRGVRKLGDHPNPTEYLVFKNATPVPNSQRSRRRGRSEDNEEGNKTLADIQIHYLEVTAPYQEQWPTESHSRIFIASKNKGNEETYAREVLANFISRAWRRPVTDAEIDRHLAMFNLVRPKSIDFQEAMIEVLATSLSSPKFLYLAQQDPAKQEVEDLSQFELATRLAMFLWSSTPDEELLKLAAKGKLKNRRVLLSQTKRMLSDPRSERLSRHFVEQWLGMQLLDYLEIDEEVYPKFDADLKEAMQEEPVAFFQEVLSENRSVLDFLHADYAMVNERLASHYGLPDVYGNDFRRVKLSPEAPRGGILTQAGLLAMNSDGKDSHPLKRSIWLLENILHDPPPPPPPAVPEIDLTDPDILKMTLKERMEDHRNDPACYSCHAKIDPWGIALENFDAVGSWRDEVNGKPVDATSELFNNQKLDGIDGLKHFLLANRQDQFCHAMTHKLTTYALGRPLSFSDRANLDEITSKLRKSGDRLGDLISFIITSDLFMTK
ncbi:DUF1592 domain-containing protein [bacterium]|nr:DUF1592 domain-containing protein [bacterium]